MKIINLGLFQYLYPRQKHYPLREFGERTRTLPKYQQPGKEVYEVQAGISVHMKVSSGLRRTDRNTPLES